MWPALIFILTLFLCLQPQPSFAHPSAVASAASRKAACDRLLKGWLFTEQTRNIYGLVIDSTPVDVPWVKKPADTAEIFLAKGAPRDLTDYFIFRNGDIRWPKHPFNTEDSIPHFSDTPWGRFEGFPTASRSLVMITERYNLLSLKLPTNHPNFDRALQPSKSDMREEIISSIIISDHIAAMNELGGAAPELILLREVLAVRDKTTRNGFTVRDLTPLQTGYDYIPGYSLPYEATETQERAPAIVGRAEALLLLNYGVQHFNPHGQNILLQKNSDDTLSGTVVFRDLADAQVFSPILRALSLEDELTIYRQIPGFITEYLNLRMDQLYAPFETSYGDQLNLSEQQIDAFAFWHSKAYFSEIIARLDLENTKFARNVKRAYGQSKTLSEKHLTATIKNETVDNLLDELRKLLSSSLGASAVKQYHKKLRHNYIKNKR